MRVTTTEEYSTSIWQLITSPFRKNERKKYICHEYFKRPWAWRLFVKRNNEWIEAHLSLNTVEYVIMEMANKVNLVPRVPNSEEKHVPEIASCQGYHHPGAIYFHKLKIPFEFPTVQYRGIWKTNDGKLIKGPFTAIAGNTYLNIYLLLDYYYSKDMLDELIDYNMQNALFP